MTFLSNNNHGLLNELKAASNDELFCIAIASSAGGFEPLKELLTGLPQHINNFSIVLSQSLEDTQFNLLESVISINASLCLRRPLDKEQLMPGHIYAAEPGYSIKIADNRLALSTEKQCADVGIADALFLSVAVCGAAKSIAVILSGTGSDGSAGVKSIKAAGGRVLVQRPETSKYDGMPKATISSACADSILDPVEIGKEIGCLISASSLAAAQNAAVAVSQAVAQNRSGSSQAPAVSIENFVKETLYESYQHTYVVINNECSIVEISGDAALYLDMVHCHLPCNLFNVLHTKLLAEVKPVVMNALHHGVLNKGRLGIVELEKEILLVKIMVKQLKPTQHGEALFVLIFENLDPAGFTAMGKAAGDTLQGAAFQQLANSIMSNARTGIAAR